jgi:Skp family chaperone for outer membrane proteins
MMRLFSITTRLLVPVVLAACLVGPARAAEGEGASSASDRAAVAQRIRQTVQQLQEVRAAQEQARTGHQKEIERLDDQIARLNRQLQEVRSRVEAAEQQKNQLSATIDRLKRTHQRYRQAIQRTAGAIQNVVQSIASRLKTAIPHQRSAHQEELTGLATQVDSNDPGQQAAAVGDFFRWIGQRLPKARDRQTFHAPVRLENGRRRVHARQLRIGLVTQMFISEDGQRVGLASRQSDRAWLTDLDRDSDRWVREALAISAQQQPPRLTPALIAPQGVLSGPPRNAATHAQDAGARR